MFRWPVLSKWSTANARFGSRVIAVKSELTLGHLLSVADLRSQFKACRTSRAFYNEDDVCHK